MTAENFLFWYCCTCGYGGNSVKLDIGCPTCGTFRCSNCIVEVVEDGEHEERHKPSRSLSEARITVNEKNTSKPQTAPADQQTGVSSLSGPPATVQGHSEILQALSFKKYDSPVQYDYPTHGQLSKHQLNDPTQAEEPNVYATISPSLLTRTVRVTPVRGQWTCACGDVIYDDYLEHVEGAVEAAMKELHSSKSNGRLPPPTTHSAPRRMLKAFSSSVYDRWNAFAEFLSKSINAGRRKEDRGKGPSTSGQEMTAVRDDDSCSHKFLFLCISQWKRFYVTKMVPIHLETIHSDDALFQLLRKNYNLTVGPWRRLLSLRRVSDVRFVQFHTIRNRIITINLHSCAPGRVPPDHQHPKTPGYLPPQSCINPPPQSPHPEYSYEPAPIAMDPPVGHNTMLHFYQCPQIGGDLRFCLKRFPKHIDDKCNVVNDEATAWGIELVEGRDWAYLWFVGLLAISCAMIFGVVWARVMKDVSGGFTVAGYIVGAFACLLGTIQVYLETL